MIDYIYVGMLGLSLLCALGTNSLSALSSSILEGARAGVQLSLTLSGPLVLWSAMGRVMDRAGVTGILARVFSPLLVHVFPDMKKDPVISGDLSANFCANLLGLGNAATPRGICAARRLKRGPAATDQLCRLVVLNTASIQLIPTSVAAIRRGLGCETPFDILPAVWITSLCAAVLGLAGAYMLGKVWSHV